MQIILENLGRRFNRDWIFRNINYTFSLPQSYAILGINGSGKSTLLQILNGSLSPSVGTICFFYQQKKVEIEEVYQHISLAAPYLELIEEFSLSEMIDFHFQFKKYLNGMDRKNIIELLQMDNSKNKLIRYFSSGMKQRVKLALAFCADTSLLMLDEPTANLDLQGINWYLQLIEQFSANRLTIICSNQEHEYNFCQNTLNILDYKKKP
jgi:ABC-type multidrug transport system ATPase subunit